MEQLDIDACVKSIQAKIPQLTSPTSSTLIIPRVPHRLRLGEEDAYEPQIISFGPYHHGKPKLQAMEKHKWHYLRAILSRNPNTPLEQYVTIIKEHEKYTRSCYSDYFEMDCEDFIEMMLIDGCFIVEYLLRVDEHRASDLGSMIWVNSLIQYDMLLFENQLPFLIVNSIYEHAIPLQDRYHRSFVSLALNYFNTVSPKKINPLPPHFSTVVHHLLHLYHKFCLFTENEHLTIPVEGDGEDAKSNTSAELPIMIPGATTLQEAGVKFFSRKGQSSSLDVTFSKGEIVMAPLVIDSFTKSQFRNLIAFEKFCPNFNSEVRKSFSAYVEFMDYVVNTPQDVALLYRKGIIRHFLGSDHDVAHLFNHLNRGTFVHPNHYLFPLYKEVDEYCKARRHKWRATLMHNYFSSPWAVLSIVAAGILLVLSLLQTYFSAYSAYR
ncbi:hypothetical protein AAC387_Pa12g0987 [Persea americana]